MNPGLPPSTFQSDNLVLYRGRLARITGFTGAKIEIEVKESAPVSVRPTDITLLHQGPVRNLNEVELLPTDAVEDACELLGGGTATLRELAELIYGSFTPAGAWTVYCLLADGIYFTGSVDKIIFRSPQERTKEMEARTAARAEKQAWDAFVKDLRDGVVAGENRKRLVPLEEYALGRSGSGTILKALGIAVTPENAHKTLLRLGCWDATVNPYPQRLHITVNCTHPEPECTSGGERLDCTRQTAYAIDDEGNSDPDDAIGIDGDRLWIHIADVASFVYPDSAADLHARNYGSTLYLPEGTTTMLSPGLTGNLGLGLQPTSPALSFCLTFDASGGIAGIDVHPTLVAVSRLTYLQAEDRLGEPFFTRLIELTDKCRLRRKANNAVFMNFPEVRIRVIDGLVTITPIPATRSRDLVAEVMMIAGEAAGRFSQTHSIPFPYTVQQSPDTVEKPETLAAMFAYRRQMKPGFIQSAAAPHAGLGIPVYSRVTSPLRRYIDLVAHQQLRAFIGKTALMDEQAITHRIGSYNAVTGNNQKLERLSNLHWTLVYLLQHPHWTGRGIVVDKTVRYHTVLLPDLALETRIATQKNIPLDSEVTLMAGAVDLAELSVHFTLV